MTDAHRVLVVGAGGLGSPVLQLLARSGVAHITVIDDDRVDESNLHRQTLYTRDDVGHSKIERSVEALRQISPGLSVSKVASCPTRRWSS